MKCGLKDGSHLLDTILLSLASDLLETDNLDTLKHYFLLSGVIQEDSQADMTIKDEIPMKAYPDISVLL